MTFRFSITDVNITLMPRRWHVLVCDDDIVRHERYERLFAALSDQSRAYSQWPIDYILHRALTVKQALTAMAKAREGNIVFHLACLDHDLGGRLDGRDLCRSIDASVARRVLVHSRNPICADEMVALLKDHKKPSIVFRLPYQAEPA